MTYIIMLEKKCLIGDLLRVLNGRVELMREKNYRTNLREMYDRELNESRAMASNKFTIEELQEKYKDYR